MSSASDKKIAEILAENALYFKIVVENTRHEISEIEKKSDAGEKYLAFEDMKTKIQNLKQSVDEKITSQARGIKNPWDTVFFSMNFGGTGILGIACGLKALMLVAEPVTATLAFIGAGSALGSIGPLYRSDSEKYKKILTEGMGSFSADMDGLSKNAAECQEAILKNHLQALGASPHLDALYKNFPVVKEAFALAAIKESSAPTTLVLKRLDKPSYK